MVALELKIHKVMRPRIPLGTRRAVLTAPTYAEYGDSSDNDDGFSVDLPVAARKYRPSAFQLDVVPEVAPELTHEIYSKRVVSGNSDTDSSTDMDVDDEDNTSETAHKVNTSKKPMKTESEATCKAK